MSAKLLFGLAVLLPAVDVLLNVAASRRPASQASIEMSQELADADLGAPGEPERPERAPDRRGRERSETPKVGSEKGGRDAPKGSVARLASGLELGAVENARPELGAGWWNAESWAGGGSGRWTREEALLRLERQDNEPDVLLDVSFSHPSNLTTGFVEVNGRRLLRIRHANGRRRLVLGIGSIPERALVVRFVAEKPFVGREHGMRGMPVPSGSSFTSCGCWERPISARRKCVMLRVP